MLTTHFGTLQTPIGGKAIHSKAVRVRFRSLGLRPNGAGRKLQQRHIRQRLTHPLRADWSLPAELGATFPNPETWPTEHSNGVYLEEQGLEVTPL